MTTKSLKNKKKSCFDHQKQKRPINKQNTPTWIHQKPISTPKKNSRIIKKTFFESKNQNLEKYTCLNQRKIQKEVVMRNEQTCSFPKSKAAPNFGIVPPDAILWHHHQRKVLPVNQAHVVEIEVSVAIELKIRKYSRGSNATTCAF